MSISILPLCYDWVVPNFILWDIFEMEVAVVTASGRKTVALVEVTAVWLN